MGDKDGACAVPPRLHIPQPYFLPRRQNLKNTKPTKPADRQAVLKQTRNLKMAASAHAYVRGSTVQFYEWLQGSKRAALPEGPPVWICGDCHVGNLGPVASADGEVEIQIRDLDQTVIGNPSHDLVRLGLSLAMAARSSDLPGVTTARMLEQVVRGYQDALSEEEGKRDGEGRRPDIVRRALREAAGRSWKHLADERIEGCEPEIPLGKRFWKLTREERSEIETAFAQEKVRRLLTSLRGRDDDDPISVIDAAYWRKGCSSLGRLRYAVLVAVGGRKATRHCLVDVKEAIAAAAPHAENAVMPKDHAARVVEGARHLAPHLGERMVASRVMGRSVFIRELLPQDLKLEIEGLTRDEAMEVARTLAGVVGRAHARQMAAPDRQAWCRELAGRRRDTLEAPSWLWASIVELVASHEAGYLEHCRRYALEDEAA